MYNKCVFCTRFHVRERLLSDFLNQKLTFSKSSFPSNFVHDVFLHQISLFIHYHGIIYASRDKNLENDYANFGGLYYEEVDRPFLLYKFYLEILGRVIFNNFFKKVMPIMLNDFDLNVKNTSRRKKVCGGKSWISKQRKQIIFVLVKEARFFALEIFTLINKRINTDDFSFIFYIYKKGVDYNHLT